MEPLLILFLVFGALGLFVLAFTTNVFSSPPTEYTPSLSDIAEEEARLRAETKLLMAQAERDEVLLKAETARVTLEDIRALIKNERRR